MGDRAIILHGDCLELLPDVIDEVVYQGLMPVVVTDPPFNIGYHYKTYRDKMQQDDYYAMLGFVTALTPSVVVGYPEMLHRLSIEKRVEPDRVVSWVYNSNTPRQHRDIAYFGITPDFNRVKQPYKNQNDKRIKERMARGLGARLYDWWNVNQVKNTSAEKTAHPCQMPLEVMRKAIGVLPDGIGVIDPFAGSGTTLLACQLGGVPSWGIEIDGDYCEIAKKRTNAQR